MAFPPKSMADFGDFTKLFADLKFPAVPDMDAFVSASRRNMETLTAANRGCVGGSPGGGPSAHGNRSAEYGRTDRGGPFAFHAEAPQAKAAKQAELLKLAMSGRWPISRRSAT